MRRVSLLIGALLVTSLLAASLTAASGDAGSAAATVRYRLGDVSLALPANWTWVAWDKPEVGKPYGTLNALAPVKDSAQMTLETLPNRTIKQRPHGSLQTYGPQWYAALKASVPQAYKDHFRWVGAGIVRLPHVPAYRVEWWALDGALKPLILNVAYLLVNDGAYYNLFNSFIAWNPTFAKKYRPAFAAAASSLRFSPSTVTLTAPLRRLGSNRACEGSTLRVAKGGTPSGTVKLRYSARPPHLVLDVIVTGAQPATKYGVNLRCISYFSPLKTDPEGSANAHQTTATVLPPGDFSIDVVGPGIEGADADLYNAGPFNVG